MTSESPSHLGQRIPRESISVIPSEGFPIGKCLNISMQTGEEFSMEFLHDRAANRMVSGSVRPDLDHQGVHTNKAGLNFNQNHHLGYEDLTGILGLRRVDSGAGSDISGTSLGGKGRVMGVVEKGLLDNAIKSHMEAGGRVSGNYMEEMNFDHVVPGNFVQMSGFPSDHPHGFHPPYGCGSGTADGFQIQSSKMKFLCSFGGRILPRPSDGRLRYVGGETRIITIKKNICWRDLMQKTFGICNQQHTIKYQLPGEDLDALISVSSDEDLQNMIEEYHGLERVEGSQRLRLFLISSSESENDSFVARGNQSNSEYHYVVAVNGALDASVPKSPSAHSLALGHNLEGAPSFHIDSPQSMLRFDLKDCTSPKNLAGMFVHPAAQFFIAAQNCTQSPTNSPPFSPVLMQRKDSRNALKQLFEDQLYHAGNENASFLTEQPPENSHVIDPGHLPHGVMSKHPPNKHMDPDQLIKPPEMHFHNRTHSRDFAPPPSDCNNSDLAGYSVCEKPGPEERIFYSENFQTHQEDYPSKFLEANDPHNGMIHALFDSQLQEHGHKPVHRVQEGTAPLLVFSAAASPSPVCHNIRQEGLKKSLENIEVAEPNHTKSAATHPIAHDTDEEINIKETTTEPKFGSHKNYEKHEFSNPETVPLMDGTDALLHQWRKNNDSDINRVSSVTKYGIKSPEYVPTEMLDVHISPQQLQSGSMFPAPSFIVSEACPNDKITSELPIRMQRTTKDQKYGSSELSKSDLINEDGPHRVPEHSTKQWYDDERSSSDLLHGPSSSLANVSPGILSVVSTDRGNNQEERTANVVSLSPLSANVDAGLNLNLHTDDTASWSLHRDMVMEEDARREASFLDQEHVKYEKIRAADKVEYYHKSLKRGEDILVNMGIENDSDRRIQNEPVVLVEDVTDCMPAGIYAEIGDILSPKITEAESGSESEEAKAGDMDMHGSISDAAIAEMEAGIYGLQIIKNADLEELRELGSGTFGTVYHGKWRGTDVAIKRIKKSCFAGRSSEQETLTKDFWREAQILSKLHHPNVVAFYGVVPDGAGGTLATVTEFMVNGSLRHVLLRKDRTLDRRKRLIIAMDAAFGMEYLHSKNIVHFDLKCDNLLVNMRDSHRPICKVGDFGLSRIKRNTLVSGGVRGTLPWMAPELLNGSSSRVSEKVDVFSFGIAMWEILTGEEPYANMHCGAIIGGIVNNTLRPPIPDRCDPEWRKLMEQCWSPDPEARPSFTEITNRLRVISMALPTKGQSPMNR
ncbi:hypothetical protein AAC387_Pa05g0295 [Persea americana]